MGKLGFLIIHGFNGTTDEVKPLSEFLNAHGYTTYCPLLNGHGKGKKQLAKSNHKAWIDSAQQAYNYLKTMCDKIIVIGFSMGGLIALNLSVNNDIRAIITLSSPIKFCDLKLIFKKIIGDIKKMCFNNTKAYITWLSQIPLSSCINFIILLYNTRQIIKSINIPCFIIQGKNDDISRWISAKHIFENIISTKKQIKYYDDAPHLICKYKNSDTVFQDILNFAQKVEQAEISKANAI